MSAAPVNDDERPLGLAAFSAVRNLGSMDVGDLRALLGHITGHLVQRQGALLTGQALCNAMRAAQEIDYCMTLPEIALQVASKHGLTVDDLRTPHGQGGSKRFEFSHPRQEAYWHAYRVRRPGGSRRYSLTDIGNFFGGRDHTTILWGVRAHATRLLKAPLA